MSCANSDSVISLSARSRFEKLKPRFARRRALEPGAHSERQGNVRCVDMARPQAYGDGPSKAAQGVEQGRFEQRVFFGSNTLPHISEDDAGNIFKHPGIAHV